MIRDSRDWNTSPGYRLNLESIIAQSAGACAAYAGSITMDGPRLISRPEPAGTKNRIGSIAPSAAPGGLAPLALIPAILSLLLSAIHLVCRLPGQGLHVLWLPHFGLRWCGLGLHAPWLCLAARRRLDCGGRRWRSYDLRGLGRSRSDAFSLPGRCRTGNALRSLLTHRGLGARRYRL